MYVRTRRELETLVQRLRGAPRLAIDTEFVRDRQYYPRLETVQVGTLEQIALIDFRATGTIEPFADLLHDAATLKIFHAGAQDLEIFFNLTGRVPAPIFDTQVAAAIVGLGPQVGYARLVDTLLGVTLDKAETLTDWSRRPLSDAQVEYALDDVRYLPMVYAELHARLEQLGRSDWLEEEWATMTDPATYRRVEPRAAYRHVSGAPRLRGRELAVLRELAAWREEEGVRRDRAPSLIVRDNVLVELARRMPETRRDLEALRGLHPREVARQGDALLAAIRRGRTLPRREWPRLPDRVSLSGQQSSLVSLMQSWLRARADEMNIAPHYLSTTAELKTLVTAEPGEREELAVLRGWRRRLVGADLLALVEGRASLAWTPGREQLRLVRHDDGAPS